MTFKQFFNKLRCFDVNNFNANNVKHMLRYNCRLEEYRAYKRIYGKSLLYFIEDLTFDDNNCFCEYTKVHYLQVLDVEEN